jgi:hypothetical protein
MVMGVSFPTRSVSVDQSQQTGASDQSEPSRLAVRRGLERPSPIESDTVRKEVI